MQRTVRDLAWLAGLLEGEGCFSLAKGHGPRHKITIQLSMTDEDVVRHAAEIAGVGASVKCYQRGGKDVFVWIVGKQNDAAALMMTLCPLMGERRQAKIRECLKAWRDTVRGKGTATRCLKGHEKIGDNLFVGSKGEPLCRICVKAAGRNYMRRQRSKS